MWSRRLSSETILARVILASTLAASALLALDLGGNFARAWEGDRFAEVVEHTVFVAIVGLMLYGNLVYQVTRLGYLVRRARHRPGDPGALWKRCADADRSVAILVPSYCEEACTVRRSLVAAALQDYPNRRVILLIDDPPEPADRQGAARLRAARHLPGEVLSLLEKPATRFCEALADFLERDRVGEVNPHEETRRLGDLHAEAASWFESAAENETDGDHAARHFVELVLCGPARALRERSEALEKRAAHADALSLSELRCGYERLARRFAAEITSFERKRYENLSHAASKAMNLNAYLALLGGSHREVVRDGRLCLEPAEPEAADLVVPDAEFVITLDADSVIAPDYALRLVDVMLRPGNERLAIAQTPYSAFPCAPRALERIAGATTDIQYVIHQGFTRHGATYWVGANALIRMAALRDICVDSRERGFRVPRFIQDRTVIEDTESTVDLIERGWSLYNYPERLAFSESPRDFGALLIQRRRWANGGLLIVPKLLGYLWRERRGWAGHAEAWCRLHYLTSIAGVNLGLLLLLVYPFEQNLQSPWLILSALPYFVLYGRDLSGMGYAGSDAIRAYALNLLLLPVNLAGVLNSLRQAATGRKVPFGRTPKVAVRTCAPARFVAAQLGLLLLVVVLIAVDLLRTRWLHAAFGLVNGGLLAYALVRFVGIREALEDLRGASRGG